MAWPNEGCFCTGVLQERVVWCLPSLLLGLWSSTLEIDETWLLIFGGVNANYAAALNLGLRGDDC